VRLTGLTGMEPLSESCLVSPAGTSLTGGAHRFDRCWSVDSRFGVPLCSRVRRVCMLVPRSSGTPVATWAWPIWVVSRRRVLEAVFILLEFPSPSRKIFIGSHSLPTSLVRRIGPSPGPPLYSPGGGFLVGYKAGVLVGLHGTSPSRITGEF
jgi:hypothetical protein